LGGGGELLVENKSKKEINITLQTEGLKKKNVEKLRRKYNVAGCRERKNISIDQGLLENRRATIQ